MQTELKPEIQFLKGVGPKRALLLESELGIKTVNDLIRTYPYKYIDRSTIIPIAGIRTDSAYIQVRARVVSATVLDKSGRLSVMIADESAQMELVFFKGIKYMLAKLQPGKTFIFFGKPSFYNGWMNMVHPEVDDVVSSQPLPAGTMTGVYPSTEKLKNAGITGKVMNKIMAAALQSVSGTVTETLPEYILKEKGLVPLAFALTNIHFPKDMNALRKAEYRLKFEELFFLQLSLLKQRARNTDAKSRRRVQYLLQCIAVQPDRSAKAGDKGDPRRHDERQADEPAAPGGRGVRKDHGGGPLGADSIRKRISVLHNGTYRSAC